MTEGEDLPAIKVLFVDDEENILTSLRRLTMNEDFEILLANSAAEALDLLKGAENVALIVSDQRMPDMTGVEFLAKARNAAPDALRIILTGYADINATIDAINIGGAYRYLSKPWVDEDMLEVLRDGVNKYILLKGGKELADRLMTQNEELKEWNVNLKNRVMKQTTLVRKQIEELRSLNEKGAPLHRQGEEVRHEE